MDFDKALASVYAQQINAIVDGVLGGGNRSVIGLNSCAREFVYECAISKLRLHADVQVLESRFPLPLGSASDDGCDDPCSLAVDGWLKQLGNERFDAEETFPRKIKRLQFEAERVVREEQKKIIFCLRDFGNVRHANPERLDGFLRSLLKVNECPAAGCPRLILESSRALSLLDLLCPDISETTPFSRMCPPRSQVWIRPMTHEQILLLFHKIKHKCAKVDDIFEKTIGSSHLVRMIVDGCSEEEFHGEFGRLMKSIRTIFADFPSDGAIVARSNNTLYDELVDLAKGEQVSERAREMFRKYGLFVFGTDSLPAILKSDLLRLDDQPKGDQKEEKDPHVMMHSLPPSTVDGYEGKVWMHAGRFMVKNDWSEIHLFSDRKKDSWVIKSRRSDRGRGKKDQSDNALGIALLSYFMKKYYDNLYSDVDPEHYYESAPVEKCGNQSKSTWRRYMASSEGLQAFFKSQMKPTHGKKNKSCWGILPDKEWISTL